MNFVIFIYAHLSLSLSLPIPPSFLPFSLHQLRCAVQAVCVVVELSYLLDPLTGPRITSLSQLLVRCIHATTSSINLLSQLAAIKAKLPPPAEAGT